MPRDERLATIANHLIEQPNDARGLTEWGRSVGASVRTISRIWHQETGIAFRAWRKQVRLQHADELIRRGISLAEAARTVGYSNQNAFSDAFAALFDIRPSDVPQDTRLQPASSDRRVEGGRTSI